MIAPLVDIAWLKANLNQVTLIDASLENAVAGGSPRSDQQIPGSLSIDLGHSFYDRGSDLPHMLPSPKLFEIEASALGISNSSVLVVYDSKGVYSSPRVRWMFKVMGHENVAVLDGGLQAWLNEGLPLSAPPSSRPSPANYQSRFDSSQVVSAGDVEALLQSTDAVVIDARSHERFQGLQPEPRKGLRSGHMPGSVNLPFSTVVNGTFMRSRSELEAIFSRIARKDQRLIFSCGSGVTACIDALAAELAGFNKLAIYDGSWSEWGQRPL